MNDIVIARGPKETGAVSLLALKGALALEIKGLKRSRRPSAYAIVKQGFGLHGTKESVYEQFVNMLKASGILLPEIGGVAGWLEVDCKAFDVVPVQVTIGNQTWVGARYKQEHEWQAGMDGVTRGEHQVGEKYTTEAIYCVGKLPLCYDAGQRNHVCFPFEGEDWYIAGYGTKDVMREPYSQYHPFGENFQLRPWRVPDGQKIDHYGPTYKRINLTVTNL